MTRRTRTQYQPFHGAHLPKDLSEAVAPAIAEHGASKLLRAMILAWERLPPAERAKMLVRAASVESASVALGDIAVQREPPTEREIAAAEREWKVAQTKFSEALAVSDLEMEVLRLRWLSPEPPTHDQVAGTLALNSKQHAQVLEQRATHKLLKWLVALVANARR